MTNEFHVHIQSDADIAIAKNHSRMLGKRIKFSPTDLTVIATAISEVARNILVYAKNGDITIDTIDQNGKRGMAIIANDNGPGIKDISLAMQDGFSTGKSLGLGLPGTRRLMDEFQVTSTLGKGTNITMKKWITQND